jgi:hypothetical protein
LLFVDIDEEDVAAELLPLVCAPELLVCMEAWDWPEAPACPEAVVCAAVAHAPNIPRASNESIRFISKSSYPSIRITSPTLIPQILFNWKRARPEGAIRSPRDNCLMFN